MVRRLSFDTRGPDTVITVLLLLDELAAIFFPIAISHSANHHGDKQPQQEKHNENSRRKRKGSLFCERGGARGEAGDSVNVATVIISVVPPNCRFGSRFRYFRFSSEPGIRSSKAHYLLLLFSSFNSNDVCGNWPSWVVRCILGIRPYRPFFYGHK